MQYEEWYNKFRNEQIHPNALNNETFGRLVWEYKENEAKQAKKLLKMANSLIETALICTNGGNFMGAVLQKMKEYKETHLKEG